MRFRPRIWWLLSLLLFGAAYWMWTYAEKVSASHRVHAGLSPAPQSSTPPLTTVADSRSSAKKSYRLSNTRLGEKELLRSNHAILLRNALIDTDRPLKLDIPAHLRAKGAPGSYIVQSQDGMDQRFYDRLKKDGAEFVSYIPNNAALVRATPEQAQQMAADANFQAVLPYEPYYKLATSLLPSAVANEQPVSQALNVTAPPGQRDAELAALQGLHAQLMGEENGPFGTTLTVMAAPGTLVAIAQLPLTKEIEPYAPRRTLNDLTRVALGIATNTLYTTPNYLNLTGANVTVNMNDTGVDATHPDLKGRVTGALTDESNGHGTAVAGTIMGSGSQSSKVTQPVPGSIIPGAGFQGKATNASLFSQSIGIVVGATIDDASLLGGSLISDAFLQSAASTNLGGSNLISNNSWGYEGVNTYDMHAASFDQATRDAQPFVPGEQPLLFVFAAGGAGNGDDYGLSGEAGSILSPGTAKNVITVGAVDSARFITNDVDVNGQTNELFFNWTDNSDLVAWFSSCGNVGVGLEGTNGRFKPDVVAPGVFTITTRATNYIDPTNAAFLTTYPFPNQLVKPGQTNYYSLNIPVDSAELGVLITPNPQSPTPFPNLEILGDPFTPPTTSRSSSDFLALTNALTPGEWYFAVTTLPGEIQPVAYDVSFYLFETNDLGVSTSNKLGYFSVVSNLNSVLKPAGYVYQYGTSMSAGAVSGMLALMQEFLQQRMGLTNPAPALLKAMLINGSRNLEQQYDFNTSPEFANEQGWGLPNLPNSVPASLTNSNPSMVLVNQSTNVALATGQSQSYTVNCGDPNAAHSAVRVTLVWTDPPGDPAAGIALVNNLDLVVTDGTGTNIWLGNDFLGGDIFTEVNTGNLPDAINNVQNVYIDSTNQAIQFPLTVTVLGTRVNVNAATTVTNLIAQDYALVISSDDTALSSGLIVTSNAPNSLPPPNFSRLAGLIAPIGPLLSPPLMAYARSSFALVTAASNGVPLLHQRVGANEPNLYANGPLYGATTDTNGNLFQWHFFVFTNDQFTTTNFATNVAFTTFLPPDLATQISPRTNGADIDMYVSTDSNLTNLNSSVIAASVLGGMASLSRGGTETVILTNSLPNTVYYIGIKSEDQQGGDFGFYSVAQQAPFSSINPDGSVTAIGTSLPVNIPDSGTGPPALVFAFLVDPANPALQLRNLTAVLGVEHGNPSDLYGVLQHNQTQVVLNNFSGAPGGFTNTYNDLNDNSVPRSVTADGPGTLRNYISSSGQGMWMLTETDNALLQAGQVTTFSVTGYPQPLTAGFEVTIQPQSWFDDYVLVPNDATNMIISVTYVSGGGPVGIFLTNEDNVDLNDYGVQPINPPGGFLNYSITNNPPLAGGLWYYGIYNYNSSTPVTLDVLITFQLNLVPNLVQTYTNTTLMPLPTDAMTNSTQICVGSGQQLVDLSVGIRAQDPNLDDLVFQLTSPQGTSIVLFENRGGLAATNLGLTLTNRTSTNFVYTIFTEDTNLADVPIKFAPPPYATNSVTPQTNIYFTGFEDVASGVYTNGETLDGWTVETNEVSVVTDPSVAYAGSNFLALSSGRIKQTFTTIPGASYEMRYYARSPGLVSWWPAEGNANDLLGLNNGALAGGAAYAAGEVGKAFYFNGTSAYMICPASPTLNVGAGGGFSIEGWVNPVDVNNTQPLVEWNDGSNIGAHFWVSVGSPTTVSPGCLYGNLIDTAGTYHYFSSPPGVVKVNTFQHVALTYDKSSGIGTLYCNGAVVATTNMGVFTPQTSYNLYLAHRPNAGLQYFSGEMDETSIYDRALTGAEVAGIYTAGSSGKYSTDSLFPNLDVTFDGISTNPVILTSFAGPWQAETNSFIATNTQTTIELDGNPLGVLLDNVELVQLAFTNYENQFLPEEPLGPFIGENPQGCWTLSVWNTRQDSSQLTNGALLGWTLQLTTSSTNVHLTVLSNGVAYITNNVPANDIVYFGVDVPATANFATNILFNASGPMNLYFNQNALPTGGLPGDVTLVTLPAGGGAGSNTLTTQGVSPPLVPGRRYFLGVQNTGTAPASFSLQVNFDVGPNVSIIPLTNEVPVSASVGSNGPSFYSFTVPADALMATFQLLFPTNGQADLYARDSLPVPGPFSFDYESLNQGTSDQFIVITTNSAPVPLPAAGVNGTLPLPPTTWYLSVYNHAGAGNVGYTILATYVTSNTMNIIDLNAQTNFTYRYSTPPGFPADLIYSFTVTNANAAGLQFTVTNQSTNGNLQLLVGDGVFPTPLDFFRGSFNPGTANQVVTIGTNASLTNLSGTWYLAVPNDSVTNANVKYSITAAVLTNGPVTSTPLIVSASVSAANDSFVMYWNAVPGTTYQIQYSSNLSSWYLATNIIAQSTLEAYTNNVPVLSQRSRFFRILAP